MLPDRYVVRVDLQALDGRSPAVTHLRSRALGPNLYHVSKSIKCVAARSCVLVPPFRRGAADTARPRCNKRRIRPPCINSLRRRRTVIAGNRPAGRRPADDRLTHRPRLRRVEASNPAIRKPPRS